MELTTSYHSYHLDHSYSSDVPGGQWRAVTARPVSAASLASSTFQARTPCPSGPPVSAVTRSFVASGKWAHPISAHQRRIVATANAAVLFGYSKLGLAVRVPPRILGLRGCLQREPKAFEQPASRIVGHGELQADGNLRQVGGGLGRPAQE